jgi:LDH2 family malate/lactate/ureidoglycolate dehydrogenase
MLFAFPAKGDSPFVLDMSTSTVAEGTISHAKFHEQTLPSGALLDLNGNFVTDPNLLYTEPPTATLAPLGSPLASHKGYGLAVFVEAMVGILGGANYVCDPRGDGNGLLVVAFNPKFFSDNEDIASLGADLIKHCYQSDNGNQMYRYPGKNSFSHSNINWDSDIEISQQILKNIEDLNINLSMTETRGISNE